MHHSRLEFPAIKGLRLPSFLRFHAASVTHPGTLGGPKNRPILFDRCSGLNRTQLGSGVWAALDLAQDVGSDSNQNVGVKVKVKGGPPIQLFKAVSACRSSPQSARSDSSINRRNYEHRCLEATAWPCTTTTRTRQPCPEPQNPELWKPRRRTFLF